MLLAGLTNVTIVPTETTRFCGYITFWLTVDSVLVADVLPKSTVFPTAPPLTAAAVIGCRTDGVVGVAACGTVPPNLNAQRLSPGGELYGTLLPPANTATYCSPLIE